MSTLIKAPEFRTHRVLLRGKSGTYTVTILENSRSTMTDCSCGRVNCHHVLQVLAGIKDNLESEEYQAVQQQLISSLQQSDAGKVTLAKAARFFGIQEDNCPVCESSFVRKNKLSKFMAALRSGKKFMYKCHTCGNTW